MAQIDIEEKKKSPVWPWLIGALLVIALVWVLVDRDDTDQTDEVATEITETADVNEDNEVHTFLSTVEESPTMDADHQYTSNTLHQLSAALQYIADNSKAEVDIKNQVDEIKNKADDIIRDPDSKTHANKIKDAFTSAAEAMARLQQSAFPDLNEEVQQVSDAAGKVSSNEMTLDQKDEIHNFFNESAEVVRAMNTEITANAGNNGNM